MGQSIAYGLRTLGQGRIFYAGSGPDGRGLNSNYPCIIYENKILLVFKKGNESDVGPEGNGGNQEAF
jgi:hypothetical protein